MKNLRTFAEFVNENINEESAFDTKQLKHINFNIPPFDKPYKDQFQFNFSPKADKKAIENAIKAEKNATGVKYEWSTDDLDGYQTLLVTPGKDNSRLTWVFNALDEIYGKYGKGMGWFI